MNLSVIPKADAKGGGLVAARLSRKVAGDWAGMPCFFDKSMGSPPLNVELKVMVTGMLWYRNSGNLDFNRPPRALFLRAVTDDDVLVHHLGFECAGQACCTTAYVQDCSLDATDGCRILTPGRLNSYVRFANNTDCSAAKPRVEPTPGLAYISKKWLAHVGRNPCRIEGVARIEDLDFTQVFASRITM